MQEITLAKLQTLKAPVKAQIYVDIKYAPVCQDIEISAKHSDEHNKDVANVTCNLLSNPGNVTFYWMTRNSSSNHTWSTGLDSYTLVELDESIVELLCWGGMPLAYRNPTEDHFDINTIFIITFVALISFVIFLVTCRKILHQNDQKDSTVENKQVIGLKDLFAFMSGLPQSSMTFTPFSSSAHLWTAGLLADKKKQITVLNRQLKKTRQNMYENMTLVLYSCVQKVSRIELSELTEQNEEIESLLEWAKYEKRRRIRSSLF
ncbi:ig-like domain-containing protein [Caerostris extrusa]|uniref:Ig-like domain-containing protein n=1 Tax=Caerostris extrusa TaxID=172846 RepID=A0AAV4V6V8_CAEEX|nr:ig-like domain-containing protein [Caerostris extrusa]